MLVKIGSHIYTSVISEVSKAGGSYAWGVLVAVATWLASVLKLAVPLWIPLLVLIAVFAGPHVWRRLRPPKALGQPRSAEKGDFDMHWTDFPGERPKDINFQCRNCCADALLTQPEANRTLLKCCVCKVEKAWDCSNDDFLLEEGIRVQADYRKALRNASPHPK